MAEADEKEIVTPELEPDKELDPDKIVDPDNQDDDDPDDVDPDADPDADPDGDADADPDLEPKIVKPDISDAMQALMDNVGLKPVEGETTRELALRIALAQERNKNRGAQIAEIVKPDVKVNKETPAESEVLKKYKPEEIQSLREVFPELAKELGFVRKDELQATSYEERANTEINNFIKDYPEYAPENDPEGVLWDQLRTEYQSFYKKPEDPANYRKIFERIHKDLFGITIKGKLPTVTAAKEKVKVASHGGPSANRSRNNGVRPAQGGLRTDALIGFSPEEIAEIEGSAE